MKKLLCATALFAISTALCAQNGALDTTIANNYYLKAKKLLDTRQTNKLDSIIAYSSQAAAHYQKQKIWNGYLNSLCCQMEAFARKRNQERTVALFDSIQVASDRCSAAKSIYLANAYQYMGMLYQYTSQPSKALEYQEKSLDIRRKMLGDRSLDVASNYSYMGLIYREISEYGKALESQQKALEIRKEILGENNLDVAVSYNACGTVYLMTDQLEQALASYKRALDIRRGILGEVNMDVASSYGNVGMVYDRKSEYNLALEYYTKSLNLLIELVGERHVSTAKMYYNIGLLLNEMDDNDAAIKHFTKAIDSFRELNGEMHANCAAAYEGMGLALRNKGDNSMALEYYQKSLDIHKAISGEKDIAVALNYHNIAIVYWSRHEYEKALEAFEKALSIRLELFGENSSMVADSYIGIGNVYCDMKEYGKSLNYFTKALEVRLSVLGEKNIDVANSYDNLATIYINTGEHRKAMDAAQKALQIYKSILSKKAGNIASCYNYIGKIHMDAKQYGEALRAFQHALYANVYAFDDTVSVTGSPSPDGYINHSTLIYSLMHKGLAFESIADSMLAASAQKYNGLTVLDLYGLAEMNYQLCDSVIIQKRRSIISEVDKISLGTLASDVYENAIRVCLKRAVLEKPALAKASRERSFYYMEKDRGMVLFEALASMGGMKFSGIPDTLLQQEHNLKVDIALLEKKLNLGGDDVASVRNSLFEANRRYDGLMSHMESAYPKYYDLKYSAKLASIASIQQQLDGQTAIRSYFLGDSSIYIFTITNKQFEVKQAPAMKGLADTIDVFRSELTAPGVLVQEGYRRIGYALFKFLFPDLVSLQGKSILNDGRIESIIVVPDQALSKIPFEALLTKEYEPSAQKTQPQGIFSLAELGDIVEDYEKLPYLIKRYSISYSFSANLFHHIFSSQLPADVVVKNQWLAMAPVFSDPDERDATQATRALDARLRGMQRDTLSTRGRMLDGSYVTSLPGTETEVKAINSLFEQSGKRTRLLLHREANKQFVMSGGLNGFRQLHFATHGFANSDNPELSGILLAQDSTSDDGGILYAADIYGLNLNSDLVVLSACETGLGRIVRGEGIIGLSRALLYAGTKNIIVSLWKVSDQSTSDLMVDFYRYNVDAKHAYSTSLRMAKMKLIEGKTFAHPFYWSPFILIGR